MNFEAKTRALKDIIETFKSFVSEQRDDVASVILQQVVERHLHVLQEKIAVGLEDTFKSQMESLKEAATQTLLKHSKEWQVYNENHSLVFPKNCRFMYTYKNNLAVVIEEDPKCRTLLLDGALTENQVTGRHYLSLPYVIFIFHFRNTKDDLSGKWNFVDAYTGWRNEPLKNINDMLYIPILSNVQNDMKVCFGTALHRQDIGNKTLSDKVQDIISVYWSSCFNSDLSSHWRNKASVDLRLATLANWKRHSQEDSNFILECNWSQYHPIKKVLDAIVSPFKDKTSALDEELSSIMAEYYALVSHKVSELVNQKVQRFYPKDVVQTLADSMVPPFQKVIDALEILEKDVDTLAEMSHNNNKDISHYGFTPKGQQWR